MASAETGAEDDWRGFVLEEGWVQTGPFMGQMYVDFDPWLYDVDSSSWFFLDDASYAQEGAWIFANALTPLDPPQDNGGDGWIGYPLDENWAITGIGPIYNLGDWSYIQTLGSWTYLTEDNITGDGSWIFARNHNPPPEPEPTTTTEITQYGVTWTFAEPVEFGQFITGDYWVVGPVSVTSISPAPTSTRNGSAVNPMPNRQGYDSRGGRFNIADNPASIPFDLEAGDTLVSSVSKEDGATIKNVGMMKSQAVLTVVDAVQPADALRPGYAGDYKASLFAGEIDWAMLPNLTPPDSAPNADDVLRSMERPRIDHIGNWEIQNSCAEENWAGISHPCYGRDYSSTVSRAAMFAMLDTAEREDLVLSLIQLGIDNYSVVRAGGGWPADGGHHSGRLFPIIFAGLLLDDPDMLTVGLDYGHKFGENNQTYYGVDDTPLWGKECSNYTYFLSGCSGSGSKDCRDPDGLVDGCPDYRNCCTSHTWVGQMLATIMLQDGRTIWNHEAYFDYVDRWMSGGVEGGGAAGSTFIADMWNEYRASIPDPIVIPEKPHAHNTGPTGDLVPYTGSHHITEEGTVLKNYLFSGTVHIKADNVVIRNCRIDGGLYSINANNGAKNLLIEDCELVNIRSAGVYGGNFTMRRTEIRESDGDAVKPTTDVLIEQCWFHHLGRADGAHADGVQSRNGGSNMTFRFNNFDMPVTVEDPYKSNAAFILQDAAGPITNVLIEYNWMNGGNYTIYNSSANEVYVRNNWFGSDYRYGIRSGSVTEWSGNTWEETGEPLDL